MSDGRSKDQIFFDLSNTITAHIDTGALEVEEVREAVEEGIANSSAGEPRSHRGGGPKKLKGQEDSA